MVSEQWVLAVSDVGETDKCKERSDFDSGQIAVARRFVVSKQI